MLKDLAADGHTVFVSSHLMSEMAQTATRLVVIGRGRLIADTTVDEFVARASHHSVTVRTPEATRPAGTAPPDRTSPSPPSHPDVLGVDGLTAEHIGTIAWQHQLPIFELTVQQASLEEAFMTLTDDSVEYRSTVIAGAAINHAAAVTSMTVALISPPRSRAEGPPLRVTRLARRAFRVDEFRSLRSTVFTLLIAVAVDDRLRRADLRPSQPNQPDGLEPGQSAISTSLSGLFFAQLAVGVLGALLITGEYSTGMIRSSLTGDRLRRRLTIRAAKRPRPVPDVGNRPSAFRRLSGADAARPPVRCWTRSTAPRPGAARPPHSRRRSPRPSAIRPVRPAASRSR